MPVLGKRTFEIGTVWGNLKTSKHARVFGETTAAAGWEGPGRAHRLRAHDRAVQASVTAPAFWAPSQVAYTPVWMSQREQGVETQVSPLSNLCDLGVGDSCHHSELGFDCKMGKQRPP